jgi:hypothetical protein
MQMPATWRLVNPTPTAFKVEFQDRAAKHPGRRLGFFSNGKPNAVVAFTELARLAEDAGLADETRFYLKRGGPGVGATLEELESISRECDAVLIGSAE